MKILFHKLRWLYFIGITFSVHSQDIFNYENTLTYAKHLYSNGQFYETAHELVRAYNISPTDSIALEACKCYRKAELYDSSLSFIQMHALNSEPFVKEKLNNILLKNDFKTANDILLQDTTLSKNDKETYQLHLLILSGQWKKAEVQLENVTLPTFERILLYNNLIAAAQKDKRKSPLLAFSLSLIVPGLGKVYAGAPWEGLSSFMVTGLLAFSSYRAFHQAGDKSTPGWIFGSAAVGFYLSDLYGSIKQAKKYNKKLLDKQKKYAQNIIFID